MRALVALIWILVLACAPAASPVTSTSPSVAPAASADVLAVACESAWDGSQRISNEIQKMLEAIIRGDVEAELRHRDVGHDAAVAAIRKLPDGYKTVAALSNYADRLREVVTALGPLPDPKAATKAGIDLLDASKPFANCPGSSALP